MISLVKKIDLAHINSHSFQELLDQIEAGNFTLADMQNAGLSNTMAVELQQHLSTKKQAPLNGNDVVELCAKIEKGEFSVEKIKNLLINGTLNETQLLTHTTITQDLINQIQNYQKISTPFDSWHDLPPLESNRTDLYFFGQPGSGKSCILASIFYYLHHNGMLMNSPQNPRGNIYKDQLINEINIGVLPDSTQRDGVNYIPLELRNHTNRSYKHPLNFIEMSGELFDDAYESGISGNNLAAKNYLDNTNKKLIYFVLDYKMDNRGFNAGGTSQTSKVEQILTLLDKFGTLAHTDGIFIIISKSDLFPADVDRNEYAIEYLKKRYLNLYNNIKDLQEKYSFEVKLNPYTIGEVKLQNLLTTFNMQSPAEIIDDIMDYTFVSQKPWYQRIFS
jgi:hypothetical protein